MHKLFATGITLFVIWSAFFIFYSPSKALTPPRINDITIEDSLPFIEQTCRNFGYNWKDYENGVAMCIGPTKNDKYLFSSLQVLYNEKDVVFDLNFVFLETKAYLKAMSSFDKRIRRHNKRFVYTLEELPISKGSSKETWENARWIFETMNLSQQNRTEKAWVYSIRYHDKYKESLNYRCNQADKRR